METLNALAWVITITALSIINYLHDKRLAELKERVETLEKIRGNKHYRHTNDVAPTRSADQAHQRAS